MHLNCLNSLDINWSSAGTIIHKSSIDLLNELISIVTSVCACRRQLTSSSPFGPPTSC